MTYLFLWSGTPRGDRKARIPAIPAPGMIGHIGPHGLVVPCPDAVRAALPARHRPAFDRREGDFWFDRDRNNGPAALTLRDRRGRELTTIYCQPIADE